VSEKQQQRIEQAEAGDLTKLSGFTGRYIRLLTTAIQHPWKVVAATLAISVAVMWLYGLSGLGVSFFPDVEPKSATMVVRSHGDLSVKEKDVIMRSIENRILPLEEIETLYTRTGGNNQVGTFKVNFVDWQLRSSADEIIAKIHQLTDGFAGVEVEVRKNEDGPQSGKDLKLELSSRLPEQLNKSVVIIREALQSSGKFTDISDTGAKPGIEWQLIIDRNKAATFGADAALVGSSVQMVTNGLKLGEYRPDDVDDELDIRVRFPEEKRNIGRLDSLRLKTASGLVPVGSFVERKAAPKVDTIRRVDARRVVTVQANLIAGAQLSNELPILREQLTTLGLHPSIDIDVKGQNEDQE
jgi:multidrug efflux pump